MKTIKQILTEARDLVSDPTRWTQGAHAADDKGLPCGPNNPAARCWCAGGAVCKVTGPIGPLDDADAIRTIRGHVENKLQEASQKLFQRGFVSVNDGVNRHDAHPNILQVFDAAIAAVA